MSDQDGVWITMAVVTIAIWLYVAVIVVRKYICPSSTHGRGVAARPSPSTATSSGKTTTAAATKAEDTNTRAVGGQPPPTDSLKKVAGSSIAQATPISRSKVRSSVATAAGSGAPLKTPPKSYMDASMTVQSFSNPRTGQVNSGPSPLLIQHGGGGGGGGGSGHSTSYGGGGATSVDLTQDENSTSNSFYLSTRSPSPYPGADHQAQQQQQSQQQQQHQSQQAPRSNLDNPELIRRSQLQQLQPQQTPTKRVISQIQVPSSIGGVEKGRSPRSSMGQGQTYNYSKFSNVLLGSMLGEATNSEESSKTDVKRFNQHVLAQPSGFYYGNQGPRSSLPNSNLGGGGGGGSVNAGYNSQLGPGRGNADPFLAAGFKRKSMFVFNKPHSTSPVAGGGQPGADDLAAHNSQSSSNKN